MLRWTVCFPNFPGMVTIMHWNEGFLWPKDLPRSRETQVQNGVEVTPNASPRDILDDHEKKSSRIHLAAITHFTPTLNAQMMENTG